MFYMNFTQVFLIFLFVELAVSCKESGAWCLTNGQCCSNECSWLRGCKANEISCSSINNWCTNDEDCCSKICIIAEDGQHECRETGDISTDDNYFPKVRAEDVTPKSEDTDIKQQIGAEEEGQSPANPITFPTKEQSIQAQDSNPEPEQNFVHGQLSGGEARKENSLLLPDNKENVTVEEGKITENTLSIPINNIHSTAEPLLKPPNNSFTSDIHVQSIKLPDNLKKKTNSQIDNKIEIDTTSFENFLSALQELKD